MSSNWELKSSGKVRDVYESTDGRYVLLVATDKVSAFDENLGVELPGKGQMLTAISKYWFEKTNYVCPNAYMAAKLEFNSDYKSSGLVTDGRRETKMVKLQMLPIEAIVRGYITGSAWTAYEKGVREICGVELQNGLQNSQRLATPIFTPTTKAPAGEHDANLTFEQMVSHLEAHGVMKPRDRAEMVRTYAMKLYSYAYSRLLSKGIILADTKFEFGINPVTGNIMLGDELFTPDSSRFWLLDSYEVGQDQRSLDKQVIRDWVKKHPGERVPKYVLEEATTIYTQITGLITRD